MIDISSPRNANNAKVAQLEELLAKSEHRADRLKMLNEQVRKQLEDELLKNSQQHLELSQLKGQLFKAQKDFSDVTKELQEVKRSYEQQLIDQKNAFEKQLKDAQQQCKKHLSKIKQYSSEGSATNIPQFPKLPVLSYGTFSAQNIGSHYFEQPVSNNNNNNNINNNNNNQDIPVKQESVSSISSQNSHTSEEDPKDSSPELKDSLHKRMTVSIRFNSEKAVDHIRAISRSIVARDYESNCGDQNPTGGSFALIATSPKKTKEFNNKILLECKQVVSEEDLDEVLTDHQKEEDGGGDEEISPRGDQHGYDNQLNGQLKNNEENKGKQDYLSNGQQQQQSEISQNPFEKNDQGQLYSKTNPDPPRLSLKHREISKKNSPSFVNLNEVIPHAPQLLEISSPPQITFANRGSFCGNRNSVLINFNKKPSRNSLRFIEDYPDGGAPSPNLYEDKENFNNTGFSKSPEIGGLKIDLSSTLQQIDLQEMSFKLFEKFFVIGCEKEDMKEFDNNPDCVDALLPGKILYSYPALTDSPQDQILSVVHEFALPNGIASERMKITSSFRKVTDLILQNSKKMIQTQFFLFTMKSPSFYDNLSPTQPASLEVINAVNPHRLLYCFCFKQSDYLETTTEDEAFELVNRSRRKFWKGKKIYCFVSFFPFCELFNELLTNVRNQVKISRSSMYSVLEKNDSRALQKVDGDCIKEIIIQSLESQFKELMNIKVTSFSQIINIDTLGGGYTYKVGHRDIINTQSHKWSLSLTLSNMSLQDLVFIFTAFLLEQTFVFFSKSKSILTNTIHTFEQLIYPLSWPHPIIYLLPNALEGLFDSPVPIIMGVNKSANVLFQDQDLIEAYPNHIFIDLDNHRIYCANTTITKDILKQPPHLNNLVGKLQKLYVTLNPQGMLSKKPSIFSTYLSGKQKDDLEFKPKFVSSKIEDQVCEIILNTFNESIRQCFVDILANIPSEILFPSVDKTGSFESQAKKIVEAGYRQDRLFLSKFIRTQIFSYYLESHYLPK